MPVPRALPALPLPPAPALACCWRDGSYAPLGPSRPPYRPPLLLDDPVAPPLVRPSSSSALLGPPVLPPAGSALVGQRPASEQAIAPGPAPAFLSMGSPHSVSDSMATLTDKAKLRLASQWAEIISQLGSASALFQEASATQDPDRHLRHPVLRFAPSTLQRYLADWISWHTFCLAVSADPSDPPPGTLPDWLSVRASKQGLATGPLRALSWMALVAGLPCLQARLQLSIVHLPLPPLRPRGGKACRCPCPLSSGWSAAWRIRPPLRPKPCSSASC